MECKFDAQHRKMTQYVTVIMALAKKMYFKREGRKSTYNKNHLKKHTNHKKIYTHNKYVEGSERQNNSYVTGKKSNTEKTPNRKTRSENEKHTQTNKRGREKERKKHDQTEKCRKKQPRSRSTLRFLCTTAYFSVNNVYTLHSTRNIPQFSLQQRHKPINMFSVCIHFVGLSLSLAHSPSPSLYLSLSLCLSLSPTLLSCVYICILLCVHVESEQLLCAHARELKTNRIKPNDRQRQHVYTHLSHTHTSSRILQSAIHRTWNQCLRLYYYCLRKLTQFKCARDDINLENIQAYSRLTSALFLCIIVSNSKVS